MDNKIGFMVLYLFSVLVFVLGEEKCSELPKVITDYNKKDCKAKGPEYYYISKYGQCFHTCEYYPLIDYSETIPCDRNDDCVPGYVCYTDPDYGDKYCGINNTAYCLNQWAYTIDNLLHYNNLYWKSECEDDGSWSPVQCKGEALSGRCFCYSENGQRIYGQAWIDKAENMTCGCSRRKVDLEKNETVSYNNFHCDFTGNYEELQCNSGICWCADTKTGDPLSIILPETAMKKLPCFHTSKNGDKYLRLCDSQTYAQRLIEQAFKQHGTRTVNFVRLVCDYDGGFGPFTISDDQAFCTWRDGSKIKTYQSALSSYTITMTCNCARDGIIYEKIGKSQWQTCNITGDYEIAQFDSQTGKFYCIDTDGYRNVAKEFADNAVSQCENSVEPL